MELEPGLPDSDFVPVAQDLPPHGLPVDSCAIRTAQIGDLEPIRASLNSGMPPRDQLVCKPEVAVAGTADSHARRRDWIAYAADLNPAQGVSLRSSGLIRSRVDQLGIAKPQPIVRSQNRTAYQLVVHERAV